MDAWEVAGAEGDPDAGIEEFLGGRRGEVGHHCFADPLVGGQVEVEYGFDALFEVGPFGESVFLGEGVLGVGELARVGGVLVFPGLEEGLCLAFEVVKVGF